MMTVGDYHLLFPNESGVYHIGGPCDGERQWPPELAKIGDVVKAWKVSPTDNSHLVPHLYRLESSAGHLVAVYVPPSIPIDPNHFYESINFEIDVTFKDKPDPTIPDSRDADGKTWRDRGPLL